MHISIGIIIINIVGDSIGVFILHAGVAGVAWPTTISWTAAMAVITWLCLQEDENRPVVRLQDVLRRNGSFCL